MMMKKNWFLLTSYRLELLTQWSKLKGAVESTRHGNAGKAKASSHFWIESNLPQSLWVGAENSREGQPEMLKLYVLHTGMPRT